MTEEDRLLGSIADEAWNAVLAGETTIECIRILRDYHPMDLTMARKCVNKMRAMLDGNKKNQP